MPAGPVSRSELERVEAMLQDLKVELGSANKLKTEVQKRGISLSDGVEYGPGLRAALRSKETRTVKLDQAKGFPLAKKCLVTL